MAGSWGDAKEAREGGERGGIGGCGTPFAPPLPPRGCVGELSLLLHVHVHQCTAATAGQKRAFIAFGRTLSVSNSLPMSVLHQPSGWQQEEGE